MVSNGRDSADRIRAEGWVGDTRTRLEAQKSAQMLQKNDRLRPVIVPTRIGSDQFFHIREALARLELTDGLDLPGLLLETSSRLPRDATLMVILPKVTPETAIALTNLQSEGYSITALINTYDYEDFARASGPLLAEGIEVRHLRDEDSISTICQKYALATI